VGGGGSNVHRGYGDEKREKKRKLKKEKEEKKTEKKTQKNKQTEEEEEGGGARATWPGASRAALKGRRRPFRHRRRRVKVTRGGYTRRT